ncbi:MAG TPA: ribonuclease E inhibitor RraB [Usitatibacteraceae bacterium]|nr:ribonuclease E inhibitor RraB [Usitatibacteraceae bacterium]
MTANSGRERDIDAFAAANADVFRRMREAGFDFTRPHDVEFFAVFRTEALADEVAQLYVDDHEAGDRLVNVETRPADKGGMELLLVKRLVVTPDAIAAFERKLQERIGPRDAYLDGWGVLQE